MLSNVQGERGLTHAWPRRDYDHFGGMHSTRHAIELDKSSRDAGDGAFALVEFLDRLDRPHHLIFHRDHLTFEAVFADRENSLLHFIKETTYFILLLVSAADALGGGGDDF